METQCGAAIPYWESGLDHDMVDPTTSVLWSGRYFGNGDGEVMNGPFRDMRTILGTPLIRNYGTGQFFFCSLLSVLDCLLAVVLCLQSKTISSQLYISVRNISFTISSRYNWNSITCFGRERIFSF